MPRDTDGAVDFVTGMLLTSIYFVHTERDEGKLIAEQYDLAYKGDAWQSTYAFTPALPTLNRRLKQFNRAKTSSTVHMANLVAIWVNMHLLTKSAQAKQAFFIVLICTAHKAYARAKPAFALATDPYNEATNHVMHRRVDEATELVCRYQNETQLTIDLHGANHESGLQINVRADALTVHERLHTAAYDENLADVAPNISVAYSATDDSFTTLQAKLEDAIVDDPATFQSETMTNDFYMWAVFCGAMHSHYLLG